MGQQLEVEVIRSTHWKRGMEEQDIGIGLYSKDLDRYCRPCNSYYSSYDYDSCPNCS